LRRQSRQSTGCRRLKGKDSTSGCAADGASTSGLAPEIAMNAAISLPRSR
jgi:hypothetical protein